MTTANRAVTVLGGGNTAFAVAANLALRGFAVTIYELPAFAHMLTPIQSSRTINLLGVAETGAAQLQRVTTDIQVALENDLLLLIVPAYAHKPFAEVCAPHLRDGHMVDVDEMRAFEGANAAASRLIDAAQKRTGLDFSRHA